MAALDALSESADVSLNSIAKRAGVANATLYRHFPTRGHLVLEVYRQEVQQLIDVADELLKRSAPVDAL
ncbi:MAG TPA: TetR/AcrR family transcriptional regulator, partial [Acidimicrobiales bacterium]|nr:TetR/AcrR family transcriptional regulator [Acidimicrobiales bacterium]